MLLINCLPHKTSYPTHLPNAKITLFIEKATSATDQWYLKLMFGEVED